VQFLSFGHPAEVLVEDGALWQVRARVPWQRQIAEQKPRLLLAGSPTEDPRCLHLQPGARAFRPQGDRHAPDA